MLDVRDAVRTKARVMMGDAFKTGGKKVEDIRREVVLAKSTVPNAKDWGDAEIKAVFVWLTADAKPHNPINDARAAFASGGGGSLNAKAEAISRSSRISENAWRNPT